MEKSVNSQVGSVYDTQNSRVGSTLNIESITRPSMPNVDDGAVSAVFIAASDVGRDSCALERRATELFTSDVMASGAAMIGRVVVMGEERSVNVETSRGAVCRPTNVRTDVSTGNVAHGAVWSSTFGEAAGTLDTGHTGQVERAIGL